MELIAVAAILLGTFAGAAFLTKPGDE